MSKEAVDIEVPGEGSLTMAPYDKDKRVRLVKRYESSMLPYDSLTLSREEALKLSHALKNWLLETERWET